MVSRAARDDEQPGGRANGSPGPASAPHKRRWLRHGDDVLRGGGRIVARYTTKVTSNPDGSGTYTGEATATSGTGAYIGTNGRLSMTGSITATVDRVTGKVDGTLVYGR